MQNIRTIKWIPVPVLGILALHFFLHIVLGFTGWVKPFELFTLMLLTANAGIAFLILTGRSGILLGLGSMILIMTHALIGQKMAPDSLTSGAILLINILILYAGIRIFDHLSRLHFIVFALSYFLLFFIFVVKMKNAEALFLLSLMGLAATARDFKLLSYFWALVVSFTFCQPYSWQVAILSFFALKIVYSARGGLLSPVMTAFLISGLLLVFFVLFPVLVIIFEEDPRNIVNVLKDPEILGALSLTAITATISTAVLALFCVPLAYALSRLNFSGKNLLLSLIDIPIIIPQSAAGIALLRVFGKNQFIGGMLFQVFGFRFDGTVLGIILAQVFVAMPFLLKSALSAFEAVPESLEQSAQTLGAGYFESFRRIALPLASKGIFVGMILAWARAAGEFGAVLFIASNPLTAPIAVYNRFSSLGVSEAAPLVATLLIFSLVLFFLLQYAARLLPSYSKKELL